MNKPLMPKATALWLLNHTSLTTKQIGDFCGIHPLALDVLRQSHTIQEVSPLTQQQLSWEDIEQCQKDSSRSLTLLPDGMVTVSKKKYVPLSKRGDIAHSLLWVIKNHPQLTDVCLCRLFATTKAMVASIRDGSYKYYSSLEPKNPILLGLCTAKDLED